ncbi:hypothetical protein [Psychroserpens sp.]
MEVNLNLTPASIDFTAVLGGTVLKEFNWIIDFKNSRVYIKPIQ